MFPQRKFIKKKIKKFVLPICIGLTTIPERLKKGLTESSIQSILNNSVIPEKIILTIPCKSMKGDEYPLQILDKSVFKNPRVYIHYVEEDKGPILKLLGLLEFIKLHQIQHEYFMLMDDDSIYPFHILRKLWSQHILHKSYSLGFAGRVWNSKTKILDYKTMDKYPDLKKLKVDLIETFHIAIHPLQPFLLSEFLPFLDNIYQKCEKAKFTDDIVINLWLHKNNIERYIIHGPSIKVNDQKTQKLSNQNLKGRNELVFTSIFLN